MINKEYLREKFINGNKKQTYEEMFIEILKQLAKENYELLRLISDNHNCAIMVDVLVTMLEVKINEIQPNLSDSTDFAVYLGGITMWYRNNSYISSLAHDVTYDLMIWGK